jgi:hypothetical protein
MNGENMLIWKKALVAYFKVLFPSIRLDILRKTTKNVTGRANKPDEVQTGYFLTKNQGVTATSTCLVTMLLSTVSFPRVACNLL